MIAKIQDYFTRKHPQELEIAWRGQRILSGFVDQQATAKDIFEIQRTHGYDVAAWVLYKTLRDRENFQNFSSFIEDKKGRYGKPDKDILVLVLSHNPWVSEKVHRDYQWRLKNVVVSGGFDCSFPEVPYRRSLFANAYHYQELLKRYEGRKVIFLTHSLAALELRWLLEKSQAMNVDIQGWMNVSGLLYGTSLPPSSSRKDWARRATDYVLDRHPVLPEHSRSNAYWYGGLKFPKDLPMVSLLGFSPTRQLNLWQDLQAQDLRHWGPNDGFITLSDYLNAPGVVWPQWNQGHYMDVEMFQTRFQGALHYLCREADLIRSPHR